MSKKSRIKKLIYRRMYHPYIIYQQKGKLVGIRWVPPFRITTFIISPIVFIVGKTEMCLKNLCKHFRKYKMYKMKKFSCRFSWICNTTYHFSYKNEKNLAWLEWVKYFHWSCTSYWCNIFIGTTYLVKYRHLLSNC